MGLFLVSALGGLWVAYDRTLSWPILMAILAGIFIYYMIIYASSSGVPVWTLALLGVLGSLIVAVYFVTQCGHLEYPQKLSPVTHARELSRVFPRFTPFRPHPNSVAAYLEGWLPVAVVMAFAAGRRWTGVLMSICAATLALAIFLSASRGAWLALAACLPLWWATRSRRNLVVTAACGVALILSVGGYVLLATETASELGSRSVIGQTLLPLVIRPDRLEVYRGSWYLIQDFPFTGIGLGGAFAMVYSRYVLMIQVPFLTYSHNLFLQVWLSHGLTGIFAFGWMIVAFFSFVWAAGRQGGPLLAGAWLGVAAILLHGLFDARQYADPWTLVSFFAVLGLAVGAGGKLRKRRSEGIWRIRKVGVIAAVGILTVALVFARRPLKAMAYANAGALAQAQGELAEGLTESQRDSLLKRAAGYYRRAVAMDQDNRTARQRLGMLAMDARRLNEALAHLEVAHQADPTNTTTRKALGLAYTWAGQLHQAKRLLIDVPDIVEELNVWGWWWGTQEQHDWGANAYRVSLRLQPDQPSVRRALSGTVEN